MITTYTLSNDGMYYPNFVMPKQEKAHYTKYGMLRRRYLEEHRRVLFFNFLTSGTLVAHLNEVDKTANEQMEILVSQMKTSQNITEKLKSTDQMAWVGAMNNIINSAEEIVLREFVYY
ncbi:MAG: TnpV protein [Clostridia bacterium]